MRLTTPKTVVILGGGEGANDQRQQLSQWLEVSLGSVTPIIYKDDLNLKNSKIALDLEELLMGKDLGCVILISDFNTRQSTESLASIQDILIRRWEAFRQPKQRSHQAEISNISIGLRSSQVDAEQRRSQPLPMLLVNTSENTLSDNSAYTQQVSWRDLTLNPERLGEHVSFILDISQTMQQNHRLKERVRKLDEELLLKQQKLTEMTETALRFTDSVSHEFRTPLTVIKEFAGIIRDGIGGPVTPMQLEFLNYIDSATRDITRLVEDFLDSSRLKAGTLYVNRRQVRVLDYFERLQPLLATHAATKKINLRYIIVDETGRFYSDLDKACRSLTNLVVHGIKHACEGEVLWIWSVPLESGEYAMGVTSHPDWMAAHG